MSQIFEIIENTGIQFIEIDISLDDEVKSDKSFAEEITHDENGKVQSGSLLFPFKWGEQYVDFDSINAEAIDHKGNVIEEEIKEEFVRYIDQKNIYKVRGQEPLDIYCGHWIPIPYYRERNDELMPFHPGPQNWCRMWVDKVVSEAPTQKQTTHKIVLAFDTHTTKNNTGTYLAPNSGDATTSGNVRFKCVIKERFFQEFYTREEIDTWLGNIYDITLNKHKQNFRHFTSYFALLDILNQAGGFPEIALLKEDKKIETSLVLDIGNSRTCGLVVETTSPQHNTVFDFTNVKRLQIRDLSIPYKVYEEPFDMQVAFAEQKFGNEAVNYFHGLFQWPGLLRIGKEAVRLTSIFESEDSQATLSSPKRYLWDTEPANIPWIKVDNEGARGYTSSKGHKKAALYGIASHVQNDGSILKSDSQPGATQSTYSKASLMTFALVEIIFQAVAQINNYHFRKDMGNSSFKRVLKNIVFSCPTAMTIREQQSLRQTVEDAISLCKKYLDGYQLLHENMTVYPQQQLATPGEETPKYWRFDEATCSQITYLYSELTDKFLGKHELFFKYKGKKRQGMPTDRASITIASIDIGGGTTDLMICNYYTDENAEIPVLKPTPIFWEGFNIAGDEIIKRIIEYVIIPSIEKYIKAQGGVQVNGTLNYLFGGNQGKQTAAHRIYRRQFANQIAVYCAYYAVDFVSQNTLPVITKTIEAVFEKYPKPKNNLIPYLEQVIGEKCKVDDFCFLDIEIVFDAQLINHATTDVMKPVSDQLIQLIALFDCDVLLLSGRPSNLKAVRELFEKSLVLSPDKIVNFGDYKFGDWYPFANFGQVKDPKTTVSVGALIAYLNAINKLDTLRIDLSKLSEIQSTADYLGVLDSNYSKIKPEKIIFHKGSFEGTFQFFGVPVPIGMRQLPTENWIATPIYVFRFKNDRSKEDLARQQVEYPFTVTISRDEHNKEKLSIDDLEITDKHGEEIDSSHFVFFFKTLPELEYWKDSGEFLLKKFSDEESIT